MIDETKVKRFLMIESILGGEKILKGLQVTHGGQLEKRHPYGWILMIPTNKEEQLKLWDRISNWLYRCHKEERHLFNIGTCIRDL